MFAKGYLVPRGNNMFNQTLPWIAAVTGGLLLFLGYVGFDQFYLEWLFLVPVLWAIREQRPGRAFLLGWVAGIVGNIGGFYWIIGMFQQFAGLAWPLAAMGLLLLAAANGIVFATWAWGTRLITRATGWNVIWVSPVVWTAAEKIWPEMFPNYLGASQYQLSLLTQIADVTGILGVTFLVVYINSIVYAAGEQWFASRRLAWRQVTVCATVLVAVLGYGAVRSRTVDRQAAAAEKLTVGLVQANRGAGEQHKEPATILREYREMSRTQTGTLPLDLIVWPEGVVQVNLAARAGQLPSDQLGDLRTPLLLGATLQLSQDGKTRFYNSAVLVDGTGRILGTYDKTVLVPFGEYIPFGDTFPWLYSWSPYSSRFWPGESTEPLLLGNHLLSVSLCYEDIFPVHIRLLMQGGRDHRIPDVMFNLTNDSWYGKSSEPMEHLALASFRAIEQRRSLVRVTNTGVSAFVDPVGRLIKRSGLWTKEVLIDRVPMMRGRTVYAELGDWLGWGCVILALAGIGRAIRLARQSKEQEKPPGDGDDKRQKKHAMGRKRQR
jgi:apolipoprotein N-acyltransferase